MLAWVKDRVRAVVELVEGELLIHGHNFVIDDEHDLPALHIRPVNCVSHGNRFGPLSSLLLLVWSLVNVVQVQVVPIVFLKLNLVIFSRVKLSYTIFLRRGCVFQDWGLLSRKWWSLHGPFQSSWFLFWLRCFTVCSFRSQVDWDQLGVSSGRGRDSVASMSRWPRSVVILIFMGKHSFEQLLLISVGSSVMLLSFCDSDVYRVGQSSDGLKILMLLKHVFLQLLHFFL